MTGGSETVSALKRYAADPSQHLEAVFRDIERTRMSGLPILNTALAVEAIGFTPWQGHWLGALITPWFLNLVLVPGAQGEWPHAAEGERIVRQLPAGVVISMVVSSPRSASFMPRRCALPCPVLPTRPPRAPRRCTVSTPGWPSPRRRLNR
jgi:[NiFe] hydrogenase assembly HybE family chaperone